MTCFPAAPWDPPVELTFFGGVLLLLLSIRVGSSGVLSQAEPDALLQATEGALR